MNRKRQGPAHSSPSEWVLAVLGALVTLTLIGFLAYQALAVREAGPQLDVEVVAVEETPPGFVAQLRVRNHGGGTAQAVQVVGTVSRGGRPVEEASATIGYVSPGSSDEAALVFGVRPSSGNLDVRVAGYTPS